MIIIKQSLRFFHRAPEMTEETEKLNGNYRLILEQVEELDDNEIFASDPAVKNSFKVISDRLKRFLPVENSEDKVQDETINENSNSSSSESKNSTMNCSEAIVTNGEDPKSTDAEVDSSQHPTEQPANNNIESIDIRITSYESPLEMMRTNKTKYAHQSERISKKFNIFCQISRLKLTFEAFIFFIF